MTGPFRTRTVWAIATLSVLSFATAVAVSIFDDTPEVEHAGPNTFSRSAIGHHALLTWLRRLGYRVMVSQSASSLRAGASAPLLLLEPSSSASSDDDAVEHAIDVADRVLLVLPKWDGAPQVEHPGWLETAVLVDEDEVNAVLHAVDNNAAVMRPSDRKSKVWSLGSFVHAPTLVYPQLFRSDDITPLISNEDGILLGVADWKDNEVYVLADPDVLSNHGLGRGQNAALAYEIISTLTERGEALVVDETLHGFERDPSILRVAFEPPLVFATLTAFLAALLLAWAAMRRFGAPRPEPPAIEPGKGFLVRNTSMLLRLGRNNAHMLHRYLLDTVLSVSRQLHAPPGASPEERRLWAERVGRARGVSQSLAAVEGKINQACRRGRAVDVLTAARHLFRWKQEMIHGSAKRSHHE